MKARLMNADNLKVGGAVTLYFPDAGPDTRQDVPGLIRAVGTPEEMQHTEFFNPDLVEVCGKNSVFLCMIVDIGDEGHIMPLFLQGFRWRMMSGSFVEVNIVPDAKGEC